MKESNQQSPVHWRRQHRLFVALLLGIFILVGLLAVRYDRQWDLTQSQRNSLSQQSIEVIEQFEQPIQVTAFTRGNPKVKQLIQRILNKYQTHHELVLTFTNPDTAIDAVREYGISRDGELLFHYAGQSALASDLSETSITRALYRLLQQDSRQVVFVTGHGERGLGNGQGDFGALLERLKNAQINVAQLNLNSSQTIPDNTDLLVIAAPTQPYQTTELMAVVKYIQAGGRLLWLAEPTSQPLPLLVSELGVRAGEGVLMNQSSKRYQLDNPRYLAIEPQSRFPVLKDINTMLLLPEATPLTVLPTAAKTNWQMIDLLNLDKETVVKQGNTISQAELPVRLAVALVASEVSQSQKVIIIGDADFMSNQFIGVGQNADFAVNLMRYLSEPNDQFIQLDNDLPAPVVMSLQTLSRLALFFIVGVPIFILLMGWWVMRRLGRAI